MIKILLFILFSCSVSFAGIRTVGNGGGFGEMKAHLALQEMGRHIRLCFSLPGVCSINNTERAVLEQVLNSLKGEFFLGSPLRFFNDETLQRTVETGNFVRSPILINSSLLTEETGISVRYEKIAGFVLYGLLKHQKTILNDAALMGLSSAVFANFREISLTNDFSVSGFSLRLHRMQVFSAKDESLVYDGLLLEDQEKTVDLFAQIEANKLCKDPADFSFRIKKQDSGASGGQLAVRFAWTCDSQNWGEATAYFQVEVTSDFFNHLIIVPVNGVIRGIVRPLVDSAD